MHAPAPPPPVHITAPRYVAFAIVASGTNLLAQRGMLALYDGPFAIDVAIALGTGMGLVLKFFLDKFWVFQDRARRGWVRHGRQFGLYTLSGGITTAIFWAMELLAWKFYHTRALLFAGGALGLAIGYSLKYWLDRRFVFGR
jgi:putative flippase GtrA